MSYFDPFMPTYKPSSSRINSHQHLTTAAKANIFQSKQETVRPTSSNRSNSFISDGTVATTSLPEPTPPDSGRGKVAMHESYPSTVLAPTMIPNNSVGSYEGEDDDDSDRDNDHAELYHRGYRSPSSFSASSTLTSRRVQHASTEASRRQCRTQAREQHQQRLTRSPRRDDRGGADYQTSDDEQCNGQQAYRSRLHRNDSTTTMHRNESAHLWQQHANDEEARRQRAREWAESDSEDELASDDENQDWLGPRLRSRRTSHPAHRSHISVRRSRSTSSSASASASASASTSSGSSSSLSRNRIGGNASGIVYDRIPIRDTPHNPFLGDNDETTLQRHRMANRRSAVNGRGEDAARAHNKGLITYVFRGQRIVYADAPSDLDEDDDDLVQPDGSMRPRYRFQPKLLFPEAHAREEKKRRYRAQRAALVRAQEEARAQQEAALSSMRAASRASAFVRSRSMQHVSLSSMGEDQLHEQRRGTLSSSHAFAQSGQQCQNVRGLIASRSFDQGLHASDVSSSVYRRGQKRSSLWEHPEDGESEDRSEEEFHREEVVYRAWHQSSQDSEPARHLSAMPASTSSSSLFKMARKGAAHDRESHRRRHRLSEQFVNQPPPAVGMRQRDQPAHHERLLEQLDRAGWHSDDSAGEEDIRDCDGDRTVTYARSDDDFEQAVDESFHGNSGDYGRSQHPHASSQVSTHERTAMPPSSFCNSLALSGYTSRPPPPTRTSSALPMPKSSSFSFTVPTSRPPASTTSSMTRTTSQNPFDLNFLTHPSARQC